MLNTRHVLLHGDLRKREAAAVGIELLASAISDVLVQEVIHLVELEAAGQRAAC